MLGILAALVLAAAPQYDTVYTEDGGRLVGTVIEEAPQGVAVQLPDGTTRRIERREVTRIEYADGSVSTPNRPAPPPPSYAPSPSAPPSEPPPPPARAAPPPYRPPPPYVPPPPPVYRPAPPPTYRPPGNEPPPTYARRGMDPIVPVYGVFGIGGAFMSGEVENGVDIDRVFGSQLDLWLEGGLRLNPHLALGLYVDVGVGDPSREVRDLNPVCDSVDASCSATTARVGVLLRHTFNPSAYSTPWLAVGTGFDFGSVDLNQDHGGGSDELFSYSGWEMLRLMAGVDLRANPVFGVGFYGGVAVGRYSRFETAGVSVHLPDQGTHTTVQAGLRFTLFP